MDKKEKFSKRFNAKQISCTIFVTLMIVYNVLENFISSGFDISKFRSLSFWATLVISNFCIIAIMLASRSVRRDDLLNNNADILGWKDNIARMHKTINENALLSALDDRIARDNFERKKRAYRCKILRKIDFWGETKVKGDKQKTRPIDKRRQKLQERLAALDCTQYGVKGDFDLDHIKVKYEPIHRSTLFSIQSIPHNDDDQLENREAEYIGRTLILKKLIAVIAFGVLFRGIIPPEFNDVNIVHAVISAIIKVAQSVWAIYLGVSDGTYFVNTVIVDRLKKRYDYLQNFLDQTKV